LDSPALNTESFQLLSPTRVFDNEPVNVLQEMLSYWRRVRSNGQHGGLLLWPTQVAPVSEGTEHVVQVERRFE